MATVGPYRAEQSVFQTTAAGALSTGNAHAHYVFGLHVAPAEGLGIGDARVSAANSTAAAAALIAGSTVSTDTILVRALYVAPAEDLGVTDARVVSANSTSITGAALIAGSTVSTDTILLRGLYVAMSTLAGAAVFVNGSSTGSTLLTLNFLAGTSPGSGYIELPGAGISFASSAGVYYLSTQALSAVTALYSTGVLDASVILVNGSSTGSTVATFTFPAGTRPTMIELPGAGMSFNSSAGVFYQSNSIAGVTAFYSTGVQDSIVALVNGSSTGSTLAKFAFPAGTPPQHIQFPQGAMLFNSTLCIFVAPTNMHSVSVFYSTL